MIYFIKLRKQKKLNKRRLSPSFTLIELLIVIIIIGIIISTISFNLSPDKLDLAADSIIKNIEYTQSLALKDDKYQPFQKNNTSIEQNRSKYWFKQWWQIRFFKNSNGDILIEVFSDLPYHSNNDLFDKKGREPRGEEYWKLTYAKDPFTGRYLTSECRNKDKNYPNCDKVTKDMNLSRFGIKKILFDGKELRSRPSKRIVFDNFGNVFLDEGKYTECPSSYTGDCGDINPLDENNRKILTHDLIIKICMDESCNKNHCREIIVTPTGYVYKSFCN